MLPIITNNPSNKQFAAIGQPFIELTEVGSTNSYAIDQLQANLAAHGTAWFAHHQTAGKGQRGKQWLDQKGTNIILSVAIRTSTLYLQQQFQLSVAVSLACHDFFSNYAGAETTIKWPNDIYWRDRKAAGILIENIVKGHEWLWAIVGIGVNINQTNFLHGIKAPVSLKQVTGKNFDLVPLAKELCNYLEHRYQQLETVSFNLLLDEYNHRLYKANTLVKLKKEAAVFSCTIKRVNKFGQLEVTGAAQDFFGFGEVEWVL